MGTIVSLGTVALLALLWFADKSNDFWRSIVVKERLMTTINISSEILKQAINFQIGVSSAMLAAVLLEEFQVLFPTTASLLMIRAELSSSSILILLKSRLKSWNFLGLRGFAFSTLLAIFALILGLNQVTSVLLISDIGLSIQPGTTVTSQKAIGSEDRYACEKGGKIWERMPLFHPSFAEYSEPPYIKNGVKDTDLTLRVFLPYWAAEQRQTIQKYDGLATVPDTRVTCQVPSLSRINVTSPDFSYLEVNGMLRTTQSTPHLLGAEDAEVSFSCVVPSISYKLKSVSKWKTALCQPDRPSFGLGSEFLYGDPLYTPSWHGNTYIFWNMTSFPSEPLMENINITPGVSSYRGEWLDLTFLRIPMTMSVTVCFSPLDQTTMSVNISSDANRTEIVNPSYDQSTKRYDLHHLRMQLGQIEVYAWALIRTKISLSLYGIVIPKSTAMTVQTGGSIAFALQSLLTVATSVAYYDNFPSFDRRAEVEERFFTPVNTPLRSFGFFVVAGLVVVHLISTCLVSLLFTKRTCFSLLGNIWQGLAQSVTPEMSEYVEMADMMTDNEVKKIMERGGNAKLRVGLAHSEEAGRVGIIRADGVIPSTEEGTESLDAEA
ncbi:MAG: hypothetical protein M1816_006624 [Peltula sp. TS41687]|nr:MAG: hypothetical protein M1816_006624 [Peltula sp. TS41687]